MITNTMFTFQAYQSAQDDEWLTEKFITLPRDIKPIIDIARHEAAIKYDMKTLHGGVTRMERQDFDVIARNRYTGEVSGMVTGYLIDYTRDRRYVSPGEHTTHYFIITSFSLLPTPYVHDLITGFIERMENVHEYYYMVSELKGYDEMIVHFMGCLASEDVQRVFMERDYVCEEPDTFKYKNKYDG